MTGRRWASFAGRLLWVAGWVTLVVWLVVHGRHAYLRDQHLLATQPRESATVVEAKKDFLSKTGGFHVTVRIDGPVRTVAMDFPHQEDLAPGDPLPVIVDPDDPTRVLATNTYDDWSYTPYGDALALSLAVLIAVPMIYIALPDRHRPTKS